MRTFIPYSITVIVLCAVVACSSESTQSSEQTGTQAETQNSRGYDEMSSPYYETETRVVWQRPEVVLEALGELDGKTVADIGAGTGFFAFRVAAAGANVIAIDVDERAIAFMNTEQERYPEEIRSRFSTRLADESNSGLKKGEADVVLMVNTYIYIEDRIDYFKNLLEGLSDRGEVVIIDFKKKQTTIGPRIEDRVALLDVQRELSEAGYIVQQVDDTTLQYQYIVKAVKP